MGLNLSNRRIARELSLNEDDVQVMGSPLRHGLVTRIPEVILDGEVEARPSMSLPGNSRGRPKKQESAASAAQGARAAAGRTKRRSHRSSA
jgi:hypothetical protein